MTLTPEAAATLVGTISHGTNRVEDLIPAYLRLLRQVKNAAHTVKLSDQYQMDYNLLSAEWDRLLAIPHLLRDEKRWDRAATILLDDLKDKLEWAIPAPFYFGAHPGDGSDFGIWRDDDAP